MVEIFSQEIFFVSDVGYQVMYICSFPQEKRQNMPQYFSYETKNIFIEECIVYIQGLTHTDRYYITEHRYYMYKALYLQH